jgi:hypothetical protein
MRSCFSAAAAMLLASAAVADEISDRDRRSTEPQYWSASVWIGPNARKFVGAIVQDGFNMQSRGLIAGLTLNRKLICLYEDIYVGGEIQINQTFVDHDDTIFSGTLGLQFENLFGFERTSFSVFTGPSYDLNPAYQVIVYDHRVSTTYRKKFLNLVSAEFASGLPFAENWDWTFRLYHRSGVFGLYSEGDDDGLAVGLGLKYHF